MSRNGLRSFLVPKSKRQLQSNWEFVGDEEAAGGGQKGRSAGKSEGSDFIDIDEDADVKAQGKSKSKRGEGEQKKTD